MATFIKDLDRAKPTDLDAVADGAGEIRDVKNVLQNTFPQANSALNVSNESVNQAVQDEIPEIKRRLDNIDGGEGGGAIAASVKFNGTEIKYGHNVAKVEIPAPGKSGYGTCRVTLQNQIPEWDLHYAVLVQPYSTANAYVNHTITDQQADYVEWAWAVWDGNDWVPPPLKLGFSMVIVDIYQA